MIRNKPIRINPKNKGKFTAEAEDGESTQQHASRILSAPKGRYPASERRQANFARNAASWNRG